jgi:hypothetical protein
MYVVIMLVAMSTTAPLFDSSTSVPKQIEKPVFVSISQDTEDAYSDMLDPNWIENKNGITPRDKTN